MQTEDTIQETLGRVLGWSLERQKEAVRMLHVLESQEGELYHPTDEEWEAITEGFIQARQREFASDKDIEALWTRHGL